MKQTIERISRREETQMIPEYVAEKKGLVTVDITWGKIQPIRAADGVRTVGELEVREHLENGLPVRAMAYVSRERSPFPVPIS